MIVFLGNGHSLGLYKELIEESKGWKEDIVVSCQYPHLVPKSFVENYTCVNIHYGVLPQFAGCNPIFWQILRSDYAGVTLHYMDEKFDDGDIIDIYRFPTAKKTADEVYEECARQGVQLLRKHIKGILNRTAPRRKQKIADRKYYNAKDVNFDLFKKVTTINDKHMRAVHFTGKQKPVVEFGGVKYEMTKVGEA